MSDTDIFTYLDPSPPAAPAGPLAGLSIAVQSNLSVRGWPAEAGSAALSGYCALEDATVVARLRQAGAVIVGNFPMGEFGFGTDGDVAGRVLAAGGAGIVLMMDILGEARLAAARAGVFGFKPTAGIVSCFGLIGLMPSLEGLGLMANSPGAIAAVLAAVAGTDERDPAMHTGAMPDFSRLDAAQPVRKVGVIGEASASLTGAERKAFDSGIARLQAAGVEIREAALPALADFTVIHRIMGAVEASSSCGKFDGVRYGHRAAGAKNWNEMYLKTRAASFGALLKGLLFQGAYFQFQNYAAFEKAGRVRARLEVETEALFADVDALVLPTRQPDGGEGNDGIAGIYREALFTLPANVLGLPALQIPGPEPRGGLQLFGRRLGDPGLLALATGLSLNT